MLALIPLSLARAASAEPQCTVQQVSPLVTVLVDGASFAPEDLHRVHLRSPGRTLRSFDTVVRPDGRLALQVSREDLEHADRFEVEWRETGYFCRATPEVEPALDEGARVGLPSVHFDTKLWEADSDPRTERDLAELASSLRLPPTTFLGFADERGSYRYNADLSLKRAHTVAVEMARVASPPYGADLVALGESGAVDPRSVPEAWALNRRVETVPVIEGWPCPPINVTCPTGADRLSAAASAQVRDAWACWVAAGARRVAVVSVPEAPTSSSLPEGLDAPPALPDTPEVVDAWGRAIDRATRLASLLAAPEVESLIGVRWPYHNSSYHPGDIGVLLLDATPRSPEATALHLRIEDQSRDCSYPGRPQPPVEVPDRRRFAALGLQGGLVYEGAEVQAFRPELTLSALTHVARLPAFIGVDATVSTRLDPRASAVVGVSPFPSKATERIWMGVGLPATAKLGLTWHIPSRWDVVDEHGRSEALLASARLEVDPQEGGSWLVALDFGAERRRWEKSSP